MNIAFALLPEKGHLNPYIGPAQALADAGHSVFIAAPGDVSDQMERAGLTFHHDLISPSADGRITRGTELFDLVLNASRLDEWIEQLLLGSVDAQVQALRDWYDRVKADVVVIDPLYYAAAIAAHEHRAPWASVSNSLNPVLPAGLDSALLRTVRRLSASRSELFARHGMRPCFSGCDVLSPFLNVAFATEALVGGPLRNVELVGPSFPIRARGDEAPLRPLPDDRPIVYASFGSQLCLTRELHAKLLSASDAVGAHLIVASNEPLDESEHCHWYRYAPQLAILRRASVLITHGGANSVMEAIACGVPMLLSPICNDQFHQGHFVSSAGIGIVTDLLSAAEADLTEHLSILINPGPLRTAMEQVSKTYRLNGAIRTAELIARLK